MQSQPVTKGLAEKARGILIFPEILKAGVLIGGAGGNGELRVGGKVDGYYNSAAVSYGLQFGVSKFGYVMFLMDEKSLQYVRDTAGWEVGVGPSVVVADQAYATKMSSSTMQDGIYVFFVDQAGFFAGGGVEGSKITRID
jgi:lipid-binding SYLF domain-containing protein